MHIKRLVAVLIAAPFALACVTIGRLSGANPTSSQPTIEPSIEPTMDLGVTSWALESEIPFGFDGTPGENIFKVVIEPKRIDGSGGELLVHMTPANDLSCDQKFVIKWEFEKDVSVVHEEDTIHLVLSNLPQGSGELLDCYRKAKSSMVYGGEVVTDFHVSGGSHFLFQPRYTPYQQGEGQYLFIPVDDPGQIYPPDRDFPTHTGSGMASFNVRDGALYPGEADAPHGNFTIHVSAGAVFAYDVTYLYNALLGQ
jgi:hypothetical protein